MASMNPLLDVNVNITDAVRMYKFFFFIAQYILKFNLYSDSQMCPTIIGQHLGCIADAPVVEIFAERHAVCSFTPYPLFCIMDSQHRQVIVGFGTIAMLLYG